MGATGKDKKKHYLRKEKNVAKATLPKTTRRETDKNNTLHTPLHPFGGNVPEWRKRLQFLEAALLVARRSPGRQQHHRH